MYVLSNHLGSDYLANNNTPNNCKLYFYHYLVFHENKYDVNLYY